MPRKKPPGTPRELIDAYKNSFSLEFACAAANVHRSTHYRWLRKTTPVSKHPRGYRAAFERAQREASDYLESVAIERATKGVREPVYYQGEVCGHVTRYSDALLMQLLRGFNPQKYAVSRQEVSGPQGAPMQAKIEVVFVRPGEVANEK